jgi:hypothetical protein
MAKFVAQAVPYSDSIPPTQQSFADVPPADPFWLFIERVALHGVVGGYSDSTFHPTAKVTRGQTSKFISNAFFPSCPVPPAPTATPTPLASPTPLPPTATPIPAATATPTLIPVGYEAGATMTVLDPPRFSETTVVGTLTYNHAGVAGAAMHTVWHYRTTTSTCDSVTGADGVASCTRNVGGATAGYTVVVDVTFTAPDQSIHTTSTSFTPR